MLYAYCESHQNVLPQGFMTSRFQDFFRRRQILLLYGIFLENKNSTRRNSTRYI